MAIPIALQNLLMASFRLVDTLMIGQLGDTSIAAVGLAGNVSFFIELIAFGMASGSAVFIAQYHGAKDEPGIYRAFSASFICIVPFGVLASVFVMLFPSFFMHLLTDEAPMIEEGSRYLTTAAFSYTGLMLTQQFCTTLRSTERVKLPVIATSISAVTNAVLNYVLIFGKLGLPAMGVMGAGLATSISALLSPLIVFVTSLVQRNVLVRCFKGLGMLRGFFARFWRRSLPVLCNEMLWSMSVVIMNMVYGRMGQDSFAALTMFRTVENLVFVFFVGICNACNILVGKHIGSGDIEGGKRLSKQFMWLSPLMGLVLGAAIIALRSPIVGLYDTSEIAKHTAEILLIMYGIEVGIRNVPYIAVVGIFRAGGDTRIGLIGDVCVNYLIVVPVVVLCGLVFKLPFLTTYLLMLIVDDLGKCLVYVPYYLKNRWIKPVVDYKEID
ncbi:MAG: MATE family efflux transporter [Clostridia bacterium]|nr:MATE family efflux transporter [Clostridia bacterium]